MADTHTRPLRPNYGIDAPKLALLFFLIGLAGLGLALALAHGPPVLRQYFVWPAVSVGAVFLLQAVVMFWGSKAGEIASALTSSSPPFRGAAMKRCSMSVADTA